MEIKAMLYDYTNREGLSAVFPMTDEEIEKITKNKEVMVDSAEGFNFGGSFGMNLKVFNNAVKLFNENGIDLDTIKILSQTYLFEEIIDRIDNALIIDFGEETKTWSSSDISSESDKGRLLYTLGYASFPASVPEALEDYMDYAMLWRDAEINMGLRTVVTGDGQYIVSLQ